MNESRAFGLAYAAAESEDEESAWPAALLALQPFVPLDPDLHWVFLPLLRFPSLLSQALDMTQPVAMREYASMLCRCIERKLEVSLHLLLQHGQKYGLRATLRLLPKYLPFEPSLYQMAKAHGHRDLAYEGQTAPAFDEQGYIGYRIAYHCLFYRQHLHALIRHWENEGEDCTYAATEDFLKLNSNDDNNHDRVVHAMVRMVGLPNDLTGLSRKWWHMYNRVVQDDFRMGLTFRRIYEEFSSV